jgi:hypothetical protein
MKIGWIRAAERCLSAPEHGPVAALPHLVDGWISADLGVRTTLRPVAWRPQPGDA